MCRGRARTFATLGILAILAALPAQAQLDDTCVVSAFNRTAPVEPDGTWVLPNVPANAGQVRIRATCVENGVTRSGQSEFVTVPADGVIQVPEILFDVPVPIPESVILSVPSTVLGAVGETLQVTATANFADGSTSDVTAGATGTNYTISNGAVASLDDNGLVTALASGVVLVSAAHDGALGVLQLQVSIGGDSDGDGLPDDFELANGLDPNDPVDALEDPDGDSLSTIDEFLAGLDPFDPDSDDDGLLDGQEQNETGTDPRLFDTDGDGLSDGLEVQTGSDPLDPASFDLGAALASIEVSPPVAPIVFNTVLGEASRQLAVTGNLIDGTSLDITSSSRGTQYLSSDLAICSFGADDGRVFAGTDGTCTITVSNSGFSAQSLLTVTTFAPRRLAFIDVPGFANNVEIFGDYALVASGSGGLQVVDVANRSAPSVVASLDTPGDSRDIRIVGNLAFLADGPSGLQILDVADPLVPRAVGSFDTPDNALDVMVRGSLAYVADGSAGLRVLDVSMPSAPVELGSAALVGSAQGVDVDAGLAVVALGDEGVTVIDVSSPASPVVRGSVDTGDAWDVTFDGDGLAYVSDVENGLVVVDPTDPDNPVVLGSAPTNTGGLLVDTVLTGDLAIGADVLFPNAIPFIDIAQPSNPIPRALIDFSSFRDDQGTGIAADATYVYLSARPLRGGSTRLYIGQYLDLADDGTVPPTVTLTAPSQGEQVIEGQSLTLSADASDDVAVLNVSFEVDGITVATDSTAPYRFDYTVPAGQPSLLIGATAVDLAGNVGISGDVQINVTPDPLTTVIGTVVDEGGLVVAGADVSALGGRSGTTGVDGTFTIVDVPTVLGDVVVSANALVGGATLSGSSAAFAPVSGGVTDVGTITIFSFVDIDISTGQDADGDGFDDNWSQQLASGFFVRAPIIATNPAWRGGSGISTGPFGSTARYPTLGDGRWLGDGGSQGGVLVYEMTFELGFGEFWISGEWNADNAIQIFFNGNDTGFGEDVRGSNRAPAPWLSSSLGSSHPCASPADGQLHPNCDGPNPFCPTNVNFRCGREDDAFREIHFFQISTADNPEWFNLGGTNTLRVEVRDYGSASGFLITGGAETSLLSGARVSSSPPVRACGALPGDPAPADCP